MVLRRHRCVCRLELPHQVESVPEPLEKAGYAAYGC